MEYAAHEIKQLRARMGWCQSELAQKLAVSIELIREWEQGATRPTPEYCQQMESLFIQSELANYDLIHAAKTDAESEDLT